MGTSNPGILSKLRQRKWHAWLVLVLFIGAALVGWRLWPRLALAEGVAPPLAGTLLVDGAAFDLKRETGKPVLVYFWASWCPDCYVQQSVIDSLARDNTVVTVAMQSGAEPEVRKYLEQNGLRWRVLNDTEGAITKAWAVRGVPVMFIVDGQGNMRFRKFGISSVMSMRVRLWFAEHF